MQGTTIKYVILLLHRRVKCRCFYDTFNSNCTNVCLDIFYCRWCIFLGSTRSLESLFHCCRHMVWFALCCCLYCKTVSSHVSYVSKVIPQQAELAQRVPGRLRPRIFLTFGTTRVLGRQPYAPAAFTPEEIPGNHFQRLIRHQGTWFLQEPQKKSPVTPPGIDPETSRLVAQCLNHYATQSPQLHK